ncbi:MAG: tRNA (adenosine(37)-N6)-dimethylallyltransferase MiaA [Chloroflexi bacterium]|nr:tRNA (adenosine(37)-N6)-dimethylallyltransferase MiaA [Chloroflexota bacterium]
MTTAQSQAHQKLVAIVGPTAVGKSALALALAPRFQGEIVSADSRQVYRGMDIGTAKATPQERQRVPHHLIDSVSPDQDFSVAVYQSLAWAALEDIWARGRLPFLVGGTGLYVRAVLGGLAVPEVPPDPELRQRLEERAQEEGAEALYQELAAVDPAAAAKIHPRNVRRTIRALEVWYKTGRPFSQLGERRPPACDVLTLGLTTDRKDLYRRIDERVEAMLAAGWLDEVQRLMDRGYDFSRPAFSGHGYRELAAYLRGEIDLPTAVQRVRHLIHRFARSQYAWFRLNDPSIHWFDLHTPDLEDRAADLVAAWLAGRAAA